MATAPQPITETQSQPAAGPLPVDDESTSVTITKSAEDAYSVSSNTEGAQPAASLDEAIEIARALLGGDDGITVEEAFSAGFNDTPIQGTR